MLLDIIVPHYDEPWEAGRKFFDMLALQRGISFRDFRVILVNDGQDHDVYPDVVRAKYPFEVIGHVIPHAGVSAARNHGLDHSGATWVMFCDFDDTFTSIYAMRSIMDALEAEDGRNDLLWVPIYTEADPEQHRFERRSFNWIFIHGKIFRREFLMEHGIRFCEELFFSEDTAFCRVVEIEIGPGRIGEIKSEIIPYVWTYRQGSITTDPEKVFSNSVGLFRRQKYMAEEYLKRGGREAHDALVMRAMCDVWAAMTRTDLECDRSALDAEAWEFYRGKKDHIAVSMRNLTDAAAGALQEMGIRKDAMPDDATFTAWLDEFVKRHEGGD